MLQVLYKDEVIKVIWALESGGPSSLPRRHGTQRTDNEPPPLHFSHHFKVPPPLYLIEGEVRLPISTAPGLRGKYGGAF